MPGALFDSGLFQNLQLPCELRSLRGSFRELRSMSGHGTKRTSSEANLRSAKCQKQTFTKRPSEMALLGADFGVGVEVLTFLPEMGRLRWP